MHAFKVPDWQNILGYKVQIVSAPDFVGDACKAIASCVRGAVAGVYVCDSA